MEEVNAYFERIAPEWDRLRQGYFTEQVRQAVLDQALPQPWMRAADVGSGTGFLALGLAPLVAEVHCIDASPAMLEQARANLGEQRNVHFHVADGATLPLEDGTMDLAVANMYLHHIPEPIVALREMARQHSLARHLAPGRANDPHRHGSTPRGVDARRDGRRVARFFPRTGASLAAGGWSGRGARRQPRTDLNR